MDDQQTYLLNGLLTRNFGLGRIVRFRHIPRGRQAQTFELLTHQQNEYTVYLYPQSFPQDHLNFIARAINTLDQHRFSVVPMLPTKDSESTFTAEGPQNSTMLVSLTTTGSALTTVTTHDISQLGLRLAWMHRLLNEQLPAPKKEPTLAARLTQHLAKNPQPTLDQESLQHLTNLLAIKTPQGWAHGDIQPAALLHDSDHQLRTIVDFALLHHASPHIDLIDALLTLCNNQAGTLDPINARALLESYHTLSPLKGFPWTPIVARWLTHKLLTAHQSPLPPGFEIFLTHPENLATAIASNI